MLRPFAWNHNNVGTCCLCLKPVKLLGLCKLTQHCWPKTPNNTQQCCDLLRPFAWTLRGASRLGGRGHDPRKILTEFSETTNWLFLHFLLVGLKDKRSPFCGFRISISYFYQPGKLSGRCSIYICSCLKFRCRLVVGRDLTQGPVLSLRI